MVLPQDCLLVHCGWLLMNTEINNMETYTNEQLALKLAMERGLKLLGYDHLNKNILETADKYLKWLNENKIK